MKTTGITAVLVALALWLRILLRVSQRRRTGAAGMGSHGGDFPDLRYKQGLDQAEHAHFLRESAFPLYFVSEPTGRAVKTVVNTPDPRIYRLYDQSPE